MSELRFRAICGGAIFVVALFGCDAWLRDAAYPFEAQALPAILGALIGWSITRTERPSP
jgi:hypothetical protein